MKTLSIHWLCNLPSPYNDFLFRSLAADKQIDLRVHYIRYSSRSYPWKTPLRVGYCSRIQDRIFGIDWFLIKKTIVDKKSIFLLGGWADASSILLIFLCILLQRKYVFWTDTPNISRKRPWLLAGIRNVLLHIFFKRAYAILCTGTPAIYALCKMAAPREKLVNFPYWVDVYGPQPIEQSVRSNRLMRFVSSGRVINYLKGHDLAIRSLAKAFEQAPAVNFEYVIAGTGPDVEKLKELAEQLGIGEKIKFPGWVEPDDLAKMFHNSDVLIHPSPIHEPYGVAVIEAMAAGMIVFASDVTCAGLDRINHSENGFIHTAGNVDGLAEQIAWLIKHPERMPAIKSEARKTAEQWPVSKGVEIVLKIFTE